MGHTLFSHDVKYYSYYEDGENLNDRRDKVMDRLWFIREFLKYLLSWVINYTCDNVMVHARLVHGLYRQTYDQEDDTNFIHSRNKNMVRLWFIKEYFEFLLSWS